MREIKFRAWDLITNKMEYCGLERIGGYHQCLEHPIMQFTSLHDKNGKEIYEGDILDSPSGNKFKVIWYKDGWFYANIFDNNNTAGTLRTIAEDWGVIGNVYENPELLENK